MHHPITTTPSTPPTPSPSRIPTQRTLRIILNYFPSRILPSRTTPFLQFLHPPKLRLLFIIRKLSLGIIRLFIEFITRVRSFPSERLGEHKMREIGGVVDWCTEGGLGGDVGGCVESDLVHWLRDGSECVEYL